MPSMADTTAAAPIKLLVIGDSGTGKTGSLVSLLQAGYRIRVLDMDNGLDIVRTLIRRNCPDRAKDFEYETLRDKTKITGNDIRPVGIPTAYTRAVKLMEKWSDGSEPAGWGLDTVFVVDSLTFLSESAFLWKEALNPTAKDRRQIYGAAQESIADVLALLTSPEFHTNLIVFSHIRYINRQDGSIKGYPSAIGEALSTKIASYFNTVALTESSGTGDKVKRSIKTVPTAQIDLKNPASFDMQPTLPLETGLATFFETMKGTNNG